MTGQVHWLPVVWVFFVAATLIAFALRDTWRKTHHDTWRKPHHDTWRKPHHR